MARTLRTYAQKKILTERGGEGRVIDVTMARSHGYTGANEKLTKYIGAMNFRLIRMGMMRCGVGVVVVTRSRAFVAMLRIGTDAKIAAPLERPNRAGVKYRQTVKNEN